MNAVEELNPSLEDAAVRLASAAQALEQAAERFAGTTLEGVSAREAALEERISDAEATIASLKAEMARTETTRGRKTEPASVAALVAREGRTPDPGALDAALHSLSVEQRILVKSEMLRAGLIG